MSVAPVSLFVNHLRLIHTLSSVPQNVASADALRFTASNVYLSMTGR